MECLLRCFFFLFLLHQFLQFHVEVSFRLVRHNLLKEPCPGRTVACALVFEYRNELHEAVHGGELVGEVGVHIAQHLAVEEGCEADTHDEHRERPYHFHHLSAAQLAVHLAFRVPFDLLPIGGVDTLVASPRRVAVDDEGEETHCDKID